MLPETADLNAVLPFRSSHNALVAAELLRNFSLISTTLPAAYPPTMAAAAASSLRQVCSRMAGSTSRRSFTTSSRWHASYGFIGLGQMGKYNDSTPHTQQRANDMV